MQLTYKGDCERVTKEEENETAFDEHRHCLCGDTKIKGEDIFSLVLY